MTTQELSVSQGFDTDPANTIASLRGKVIVVAAFHMLCPGCVMHGLLLGADGGTDHQT